MSTETITPNVTRGEVRVANIAPGGSNPRKAFDKAALEELAESIRRHGVLQPILLRPWPEGRRWPAKEAVEGCPYELVAGERRWRAAKAAGLSTIPALIRELGDAEVLEIQVVENLQRTDLHPLEKAEGYEQLMKLHGYAVEDLAAKVGKSKGYVYARLKLCALVPEARKAFYAGHLNPSTALLIARIPVADLQKKAVQEIVIVDSAKVEVCFLNLTGGAGSGFLPSEADPKLKLAAGTGRR